MKGTIVVVVLCLALASVGYLAPTLLNAGFDLVAAVIGFMTPLGVVVLVSAVTGALFIMAFPHVSSQAGIVKVKDRIKFNVLAIRIYQDEMRTVARGVAGSFGWNMAYLGLNVLPMIVLAAPFIMVWSQLSALYAYRPFEPGDQRVVVVELNKGIDPAAVEILAPEGGSILNRANMVERIALTIRADAPTSSALTFRHQGQEVTKAFEVGTEPVRLARVRTSRPWKNFAAARDPLLYFGEPVLPSGAFIETIYLEYPTAPLGPLGGGEITIMLIFIVVSMAVGFGLKDFFGVEI